ncbi:S-methyl-5'-thioadenosine phosphorylase [Acetivibrio mesophilus]|uniref:Purine nucleoside phosphorylase n=1 Tax=Acetivibrio mesophilus TaxID=2487273 RepID=A0A4Q0I749_9FIRM|nr:S-methyl-5'-thioadenosine phosphorylase [Acetivibrio mesophilus]ODM25563.1 methylthioadenosine phosphorylase [Clostridium sp. Bc-iso-3]RXE60148.1 S-methyl-5'-thioadenosine phosphorylase [Acetivibrio mesophilus]HHV29094.1 S-methyl-5'-thioadenosine phosphorylase [Clostridium sp.]
MNYKADIGVFGGSGFYSFLENVEEIEMETPYGKPSDKIAIATYGDKKIAFLPRHGKNHQFPPHMIPYRANLYAMKKLGVKKILAPTSSGSLQPNIKPGDFVICDQFVDRTTGRKDTFYDGPVTKHISSAHPYCPELRKIAIEVGKDLGITTHEKGTVVVIQGPRFSTVAESRWFNKMGWDVINMTQYPEAYLARELGICYANISLITDYDAGLEGRDDIAPVTEDAVLKVFAENNEKVKNMLFEVIGRIDLENDKFTCCNVDLTGIDL